MPGPLRWIVVVAAVAFLAACVALGRAERGGPPHVDLTLPGGLPATFTVPGEPRSEPGLPTPDVGSRPPAVVLVHGYSADRAGMSTLARRLARGGYAVLAPDLMGHGANRNPFQPDGQWDRLSEDVAAAVDFLRVSGYVDGTRISVVGHSMGAGSVLRFAERDSGIDAAVMLSGGWALFGPYRPPNALFLVAEHDPEDIRSAAARIAARVADEPTMELDRTYGDPAVGTGVRLSDLPGNDHSTILFSPTAAREVLAWLDAVYGIERSAAPDFREPRLLSYGIAMLAVPWLVFALGLGAGNLAPRGNAREGSTGRLIPLAVALVAALPFAAVAPITALLSLEVVDALGAHWLYAGVGLVAWLASRGELHGLASGGVARTLGAAGCAFVGWSVLLAPTALVLHRLTPTPERALAALGTALAVLPFFVAFEHLVRGGSGGASFARGLAGRALLIAALLIGVGAGVLPFVVILLIGPLALTLLLLEVATAALWARSQNVLAPALFEAAVLGWTFAALMPIRV